MNPERESIVDGLKRLASSNDVQPTTRERAKALLSRLEAPVRVAILGLPHSGKSTLLNVFAGRRLLPPDVVLPPVEFRYGSTDQLRVTSESGDAQVLPGLDFSQVPDDALYVQAEADLPVLKEITLLEVAAEGTGEEQESALRWASRRADIAVWCSQEFARVERLLWASAPDQMKDHGFLAITMADRIGSREDISSRMSVLKAVAEQDFLHAYPVASEAALAALDKDDKLEWSASGGDALRRAVLDHAHSGRRADLDAAHVFVLRHQDVIDRLPQAEQEESSDATPDLSPESPKPEVPPASEPATSEAGGSGMAASCSEGAQFLRSRANEIGAELKSLNEEDAADHVLGQCLETVEHLQDLMDASDLSDAQWDAMKDEVSAANDMIVLMQLERGTEPAADAVTLLLQLRRTFEAEAA